MMAQPSGFPKLSNQQLENVLLGMTVPDTARVQQASKVLQDFLKTPACIAPMLLLVQGSQHDSVRQGAAIHLRKKISKHFTKLKPEDRESLKKLLLKQLAEEKILPVRNAIAALICQVARYSIPLGEWDQLLIFLQQCSQSSHSEHREVSMLLFRNLCEYVGSHLKKHFSILLEMFHKGLQDESSAKVRIESLKALGSLVNLIDTQEMVMSFQPIVPKMVGAVKACLDCGDYDSALHGFEIFDDLAQTNVPVLNPYIGDLIKFMLAVVAEKDAEIVVRANAATFIRWCCEFKSKKVANGGIVEPIMVGAFGLLCEEFDEDDEGITETPQSIGCQLLDGLLCYFVPSIAYEPAFKLTLRLIQSQNPLERRGGYVSLRVMADESPELLIESGLKELLGCVFQGMKDPEIIVRRHAVMTLAEFAFSLEPAILKYHETMLPAIFTPMDNEQESAEVKERACGALELFCSNMGKEIIPYLDTLMKKLFVLVQGSNLEIQKAAVVAIASTAKAACEAFLPYYRDTLTMMRALMQQTADEHLELRAHATGCVGKIARGVGLKHFQPVMDDFVNLAISGFKIDYANLREHTFGFFEELSFVLGPQMAASPLLKLIVAEIMNSLASEDGVALSANYDDGFGGRVNLDDDAENVSSDGEGSVDLDDAITIDRRLKMRVLSGYVHEKQAAIQCLGYFCKNVGKQFMPYLEQAFRHLQSLEDYPHCYIKQSLTMAYSLILNMVHENYPPPGPGQLDPVAINITDKILPVFINIIEEEVDSETVAFCITYLADAIKWFGKPAIDPFMDMINEAVFKILKNEAVCQGNDGDEDEDVDQSQVQSRLMDCSTECISNLAKVLGKEYEPVVKDYLKPLCNHNQDTQTQSTAIGCVADIACAFGDSMVPYIDLVVPHLLKCLRTDDYLLQQNAAFCFGTLCHNCGKEVVRYYETGLTALQPIMQHAGEREQGYGARDNACSAVAKMLMTCPEALPLEQVVPFFLSGIPLLKDFEETKFVYECLFQLVEKLMHIVSKHIPNLIHIFAESLLSANVPDEYKQKIAVYVNGFFKQNSSTQLQEIVQKLNQDQQNILKQCLR